MNSPAWATLLEEEVVVVVFEVVVGFVVSRKGGFVSEHFAEVREVREEE